MGGLSRRRGAGVVAGLLTIVPLSGCFESPPQVVSLNPNNGSTNVAGDLPLTVAFDHRVDMQSVMNRFTIDPPLPGCDLAHAPAAETAPRVAPCRVQWSEDGTKLVVEHFGSPFAPTTKYVMQLKAGFLDSAGVANSLDHRWELTSGTAPRMTTTSPVEGATDVSVDSSFVISFTTYMTVSTTAAAVTISPPLPETRVIPNTRDHGRFVVLPGRLLRPDQSYTVTVGTSATDEHGTRLEAPGILHFHTGGLQRSNHALILAGRPGEHPTAVVLAGLSRQQPGDLTASSTVRMAPRCQRLACGPLSYDQALEGYAEAVVSPDSSRVAIVVTDASDPSAPTRLIIEDLPSGTDHLIDRGAANLSWSRDSTKLAYNAGDRIHVISAVTGRNVVLPAGASLRAPAVWSADNTTLVLPVAGDGGPRIDLGDANLQIRYPLPGLLPGPLARPALSPQGDSLAVRRLGDTGVGGTWLIHLTGGNPTPHRLGADLTPVQWLDEGTLLAMGDGSAGGAPSLVRVGVAGGDRTTVTGPSLPDLAGTVATPSGRQLTYLHTVDDVTQAFVENADGSDVTPLTTFAQGTLRADSVGFGG